MTGRVNPGNLQIYGDRLYWSEQASQALWMSVRSANLDGSDATVLYLTAHNTNDMSIDPFSGDIYRRQYPSHIMRERPPEYSTEIVYTTPSNEPLIGGISYDPIAQRVIWGEYGDAPRIRSANRDGSEITDLITSCVRYPRDVEYDAPTDSVYWLNGELGHYELYRSSLDGGQPELLTTLPSGPSRLLVDSTGQQIYVSDTQGILRCGMDGSGLTRIQTGELVQGLAVWYVPEPGCMLLLGGLCALGVCRRRSFVRFGQ